MTRALTAARTAGWVLVGAVVGGALIVGGTLLALVLLGRGLVLPATAVIIGFGAFAAFVRSGLLDAAGRAAACAARPAPYTAHPRPLDVPDATMPLSVVAGTGVPCGVGDTFGSASGVAR